MKTDIEITELTLYKIHEFYDELGSDERSHLFWMIEEIIEMEDTRKVNRWLGFIHGQLVAYTSCTVEELRNMIR